MDSPAAVIFDVDGTLVDSERDGHRVAFNLAFEEAGMADRWDEDLYGRLLSTAGGRKRLRRYLVAEGRPDDEADRLARRLHRRKTEIFRDLIADGRVPPRLGVQRLLDEVADAGVPTAIATTGSRAWVEPLLDRLFGLDRFVVVVTGDDVEVRKPDPEAYEATVARLGADPGEVVVVEDSGNGLRAARKAGLACLVVVNGYTRDHDLDGAALVVDGFGAPGAASVLAGDASALDDGAVTLATLSRLVDGAPGSQRTP